MQKIGFVDPINDEFMVFDENSKRYILTEKCILDECGINLSQRFNTRGTANSKILINAFLNRISLKLYSFIYTHNNQCALEFIAAHCASARNILKEAMKSQVMYELLVGDLSMSTDVTKRDLAIDATAKSILLQTVVETGACLLYTGEYR